MTPYQRRKYNELKKLYRENFEMKHEIFMRIREQVIDDESAGVIFCAPRVFGQQTSYGAELHQRLSHNRDYCKYKRIEDRLYSKLCELDPEHSRTRGGSWKCKVRGCQKRKQAKGLCGKHYQDYLRDL